MKNTKKASEYNIFCLNEVYKSSIQIFFVRCMFYILFFLKTIIKR